MGMNKSVLACYTLHFYKGCSSLDLSLFSKTESEDEDSDITLQGMSLDSALELDEGHDGKKQTTGQQHKGSTSFY